MNTEDLCKKIIKIADQRKPDGQPHAEFVRERVIAMEKLIPKLNPVLLFADKQGQYTGYGWDSFVDSFNDIPTPQMVGIAIAQAIHAGKKEPDFQPEWWQLVDTRTEPPTVKFGMIKRDPNLAAGEYVGKPADPDDAPLSEFDEKALELAQRWLLLPQSRREMELAELTKEDQALAARVMQIWTELRSGG